MSTEVDARLSFNTSATVARAQRIIELYQASEGVHIFDRVSDQDCRHLGRCIRLQPNWERQASTPT